MLLTQISRLHRGITLAITWPFTITVSWSASVNTASMSCSTSMMAWSFFKRSSSATMLSASAWPMPARGSSSSSTVGSVARVMAISNWRCSPWLVVPATTLARLVRPASSSARSQRSLTAPMALADDTQRSGFHGACRSRDWAARRTLSHTVKGRKMLVFW